jgi:dipeptidyl aminopeptidase/acylaminoacyl peptidase
MRKTLIALGVVLLVVVGPVVVQQLQPQEQRRLEGETLDPSRYEEVRFANTEQQIGLAGLLFLPERRGPFPAAVVIHGSGTSARSNRWYLTLTHHLQDQGIAVLLPDKRGSEQSGGEWRSASFSDLATDTDAAVAYLRGRDDLALSGVGLIGMSQGGWIAPLVAAGSTRPAFLVSVVGSAVSTHEQFLFEEDHNLRQLGVLPGISRLLAYPATFIARHLVQREFWSAVGDFDPLPHWRRVDVPALALLGAEDTNVPSATSVQRLQALGKGNIEVVVYPGSGHPLEDPPGQGDRLIRADALQAVSAFIHNALDAPGQ